MAEQASTDALVALSRWIDEGQPVTRDPEAVTWGRIAELTEESGEVVAAFIGATGQNLARASRTRSPTWATSLLDVAITALGAYEHLTQHQGLALRRLDDKIVAVAARAGVLGETLALPSRVAPSSEVCGGCGRPMTEACGVESVRTVAERAARTAQADVPAPTSPVEDREALARIIEPDAWDSGIGDIEWHDDYGLTTSITRSMGERKRVRDSALGRADRSGPIRAPGATAGT
ncbi:MAG: MazG-like family protein [Cellulomonas sp.]|uniref:MazG-like family protein n=1 Tax=Cellulomonas sp. TaxID=40001 RepID=UPI00258D2F31|nr:MazG-like family protein [Cellulomonas sp.]MCR6703137.1 MazG-like family protein [Cellulomonas sp.]